MITRHGYPHREIFISSPYYNFIGSLALSGKLRAGQILFHEPEDIKEVAYES
jgi:hypothetical protein